MPHWVMEYSGGFAGKSVSVGAFLGPFQHGTRGSEAPGPSARRQRGQVGFSVL